MTPFTREAIMTAMIDGQASKQPGQARYLLPRHHGGKAGYDRDGQRHGEESRLKLPSLARADPFQGRQLQLSFRFSGVVLAPVHPSGPFREASASAADCVHKAASQVT